jgi:hypothetical protein
VSPQSALVAVAIRVGTVDDDFRISRVIENPEATSDVAFVFRRARRRDARSIFSRPRAARGEARGALNETRPIRVRRGRMRAVRFLRLPCGACVVRPFEPRMSAVGVQSGHPADEPSLPVLTPNSHRRNRNVSWPDRRVYYVCTRATRCPPISTRFTRRTLPAFRFCRGVESQ